VNGVAEASWVAITADVVGGTVLVASVIVVGIAVGTEVGGAEVGWRPQAVKKRSNVTAPRLIAKKRKNSRRDIFFMVISPESRKSL
jgi:hypothetical protein